MTFAASASIIPKTNAHTPSWNVPTWAFISVKPNPIGIGQQAFVNFWIDKVPATANAAYGDRWHNFTVTITTPDGTKLTQGPFTSDAEGGAWSTYTPTQLGKYSFVFNFPGETVLGANPGPSGSTNPQSIGDYYLPSTSQTATLNVTQTPATYFGTTPLPDGYWQRPIFAENTEWYKIAGNWLGGGTGGNAGTVYNATSNYAPYTTSPDTGHIIWTAPYAGTLNGGGIIGGEYGGTQINSNYYSTAQYESKLSGVVINGVLYNTLIPGSMTSPEGWVAIDLRTGKTLWTKNTNATLRMGQVLDFVSPNQFGGLAYLWSVEPTVSPNTGATWGLYDAMTGNWILNIVNATSNVGIVTAVSVTFAYGPSGEILGYYLNDTDSTVVMWNSTRAIMRGANGKGDLSSYSWRPPQGASIAFANGIQWKAPQTITMTAPNGTVVNINQYYKEQSGVTNNLLISKVADILLVTDTPGPSTSFQQPGYIIALAYSPTDGRLLWGPFTLKNNAAFGRLSLSSIGSGVFTTFTYATQSIDAYSTATGQKLWGPLSLKQADNPWGYYITQTILANGTLYTADFGGLVNAIDAKTGNILWTTSTGSSGFETPYGVWPIANILTFAGGKLFVMGGHLYSPPLFHGGQLYAFDGATGKLVWSTPSFAITNSANGVIADGTLVVPNAYDLRLYAYDKGRSETTVSAPDTVIPSGIQVLIKGTVTDQSPGQTCLGIPAAGTPAISDEFITPWMEYLYMQQPKPTNATGVRVHLTAIDPNGNGQDIGNVTTDITGRYSILWTPPVPGKYVVTATFEGSGSYYASSAETAFGVGPEATPIVVVASAPTAPPTPTPAQTTSPNPNVVPPASANPTTTYVVIAAAVIIITAVAAALTLRKKK